MAKDKQIQKKSESEIVSYESRGGVDVEVLKSELNKIETSNASFFEKRKLKKLHQDLFYKAKEQELEQWVELFEETLITKKDVERKSMALAAEKAILDIERQYNNLVQEFGLTLENEKYGAIIQFGIMVTERLREVDKLDLDPEVEADVIQSIKELSKGFREKLKHGVEAHIDELKEKEELRKGKKKSG